MDRTVTGGFDWWNLSATMKKWHELQSRRHRIATIVAGMIAGDYGDAQFWSEVVEDAITVDDEIIRQTQPPESTDERDEADQ